MGIEVFEGWVWRLVNGKNSVYTASVLNLDGKVWYAVLSNELGRKLKENIVVNGVHKSLIKWNG